MTIRTAYGPYDPNVGKFPRPEDQVEREDLTKQSFKEECDINLIMARYTETGIIDHVSQHGQQYGDVTSEDFLAAMQQITQANTMFEHLPAKARERFGNSPAAFLDYVNTIDDDTPSRELVTLGLMDEVVGLDRETRIRTERALRDQAPAAENAAPPAPEANGGATEQD